MRDRMECMVCGEFHEELDRRMADRHYHIYEGYSCISCNGFKIPCPNVVHRRVRCPICGFWTMHFKRWGKKKTSK